MSGGEHVLLVLWGLMFWFLLWDVTRALRDVRDALRDIRDELRRRRP